MSNEVGVTGGGTTTIGAATANDIGTGSVQAWGIRATNQSGVKIFNTEVRNVTVTGTVLSDGILLELFQGTSEVYNNKVHGIRNSSTSATTGVSGIRASHATIGTNVGRIYNNFVYGITSGYTGTASTTRQIKGIFASGTSGSSSQEYQVDFNSVRIDGSGSPNISSTAFENATSAVVFKVRNNIFANVTGAQTTAKHFAVVYTASSIGAAGTVSNYNDFYVPNTTNGFIGNTSGTDRATLTDLRTATSQDANSISADPLFFGATDLHINTGSPVIDAGTAIAGITTDIDGQTRPNGAAPDIGADEFYSSPGNLQLSSSTYNGSEGSTVTITVSRVSGSSGTVGVTLTLNDGTATGGASCGTAGVDYENPGPQNLTFGEGVTTQSITVQLCSDAVLDPNQTFTATLSNPTGGAGLGSPTTATVTITDVAPPFSGSYNVGTGQHYTSLTNTGGIFEAINTSGATGNIVINITSDLTGLTGETGTVALNQLAGGFTVTIQPSGGARIISGSGATGLIRLNGADNVTINGLNTEGNSLTIRNTSTAGSTIQFINDASNNTVQNSTIEGAVTSSTSGVIQFSTGTTTGNDNNTITNNTIRDRSDATGLPANLIYSAGSSATITNTGNIISTNQLRNFTTNGINFTSTGNESWTVTGNTIFGETQRTTALVGILFNSLGTNLISQNTIRNLNTSSSVIGIDIRDARGTTISRNRIHSIPSTSGSTATLMGVQFFGASGTTQSVTLVNNFISIVPAFTNAQIIRGIYDFGFTGNTFNVYHNSVYIAGTASGSVNTFAFNRSDPAATTVINNIFYNGRTGGTGGHYSMADEENTGTFSSNHNLVVGTGPGATPEKFMARLVSPTLTPMTLDEWRVTAGTPEVNSIGNTAAGLPATNVFVDDPANNDLHLKPGSPAINAGDPNVGVTTDIDGDTRDSMPDIGADEIVQAALPTVQFNSATYSGNEGTTATITVTREGDTTGVSTVDFATSNGSATGGTSCTTGVDYITTSGTLNFAASETSQTFNVTLCSDALVKGDETVNLTLSNPTGATLGTQSSAVLTITNTTLPQPGTLALSSSTYTVNEGAGTVTVTVNRTGGSDGAASVNYATSNNTATGGASCATSGADYMTTSGTLNWTSLDATPKTFTVTICDDSSFEGDETFNVTLSGATGATLGEPSEATVTITDNDSQPSIQLSSSTYSVGEGDGMVTVTVNRTGATGNEVGFSYTTSNGTATGGESCTAGIDYISTSGALSFAAGETTKTFTVTICDDSDFETSETFAVTLSNPTGNAVLGTPSTATVTITDNDSQPTVHFSSATYSGNEGTTATITVTRSGSTTATVTVDYETGGGSATGGASCGGSVDYISTNGTLTFGSNVSSQSFNVQLCSDTVFDPNETVTLTLSNPTGGATLGAPSFAELTIIDVPPPQPGTLQFDPATYSITEGNSGTTTQTLTVTRTGGSDGTVTVQYATGGGSATGGTSCMTVVDYVGASGTLTFGPGVTSQTFNVTICGDTEVEPDETFNATLSNPTGDATLGTNFTATVTILNDDTAAAAVLAFSSATYEVVEDNNALATITVNRTGNTTTAVTVQYATSNGTATGGPNCTTGVDYNPANGTLNFGAGETTKTFTVTVCTDLIPENPPETVNLTLSNPTGGAALGTPSMATLSIIDAAAQFRNSNSIIIPDGGQAAPSSITVSGAPNTPSRVRVTLFGVTHPIPDDIDVLLVSPSGQKFIVMGDAGGFNPVNGVTMTFEDAATQPIPDSTQIFSGNYRPFNWETPVLDFAAPAPTGPYSLPSNGATLNNTFTGNPNGNWTLYVRDDNFQFSGDSVVAGGIIEGGFGLEFVAPTAATGVIGGRVSIQRGNGIRNVAVTMTGGGLEEPLTVYTGANGFYEFPGVPVGQTYVIQVSARRYTFTEPTRVVGLTGDVTDINFIGEPTGLKGNSLFEPEQ